MRGSATPAADPVRGRRVVDAFFAAARDGDLPRLIGVLDPDVVLRADGGARRAGASAIVRGADAVAARALMFQHPNATLRPLTLNGSPGVAVVSGGRVLSLLEFTVVDDRIVAIDALADPDRLAALKLPSDNGS